MATTPLSVCNNLSEREHREEVQSSLLQVRQGCHVLHSSGTYSMLQDEVILLLRRPEQGLPARRQLAEGRQEAAAEGDVPSHLLLLCACHKHPWTNLLGQWAYHPSPIDSAAFLFYDSSLQAEQSCMHASTVAGCAKRV